MNGQVSMDKLRSDMVKNQLEKRGIHNEALLKAMRTIPRHLFVPESQRNLAYADRAIPIGHRQTISQPYVVALSIIHLNIDENSRVLEVGTGSGYLAAVLSSIVDSIYTIEIIPELAESARTVLTDLKIDNVQVITGDGYHGYKEKAPYDAIIVSAAAPSIPQPLIDQLKIGGTMMIPVGPMNQVQKLKLIQKKIDGVEDKVVEHVRFVPLTR